MTRSGTLAASLLESAEQELLPGERILWSAQPQKTAASQSIIVVLFCLVLTAIAVRAVLPNLITILETGESDLDLRFIKLERPVCAVPVLIVFMLAGPYLLGVHFLGVAKKRRTLYVITNQRALTLKQGIKRHVQTYGPEQLRTVKKTTYDDGSTSFWFRKGHGFDGIEEADKVEDLLNEIVALLKEP